MGGGGGGGNTGHGAIYICIYSAQYITCLVGTLYWGYEILNFPPFFPLRVMRTFWLEPFFFVVFLQAPEILGCTSVDKCGFLGIEKCCVCRSSYCKHSRSTAMIFFKKPMGVSTLVKSKVI